MNNNELTIIMKEKILPSLEKYLNCDKLSFVYINTYCVYCNSGKEVCLDFHLMRQNDYFPKKKLKDVKYK